VAKNPLAPVLDETVLAPTMIRMFGRPYVGLTLQADQVATVKDTPGPYDNPLSDKFAEDKSDDADKVDVSPQLARIYGFSYEGHYYKLPKPMVFLVHGPGIGIAKGSDAPDTIANVGVEFGSEFFSGGVFMWAYDKVDMSLRIDITSGWLEDILFGLITDGDATDGADGLGRAAGLSRAADLGRAAGLMRAAGLGRDRR